MAEKSREDLLLEQLLAGFDKRKQKQAAEVKEITHGLGAMIGLTPEQVEAIGSQARLDSREASPKPGWLSQIEDKQAGRPVPEQSFDMPAAAPSAPAPVEASTPKPSVGQNSVKQSSVGPGEAKTQFVIGNPNLINGGAPVFAYPYGYPAPRNLPPPQISSKNPPIPTGPHADKTFYRNDANTDNTFYRNEANIDKTFYADPSNYAHGGLAQMADGGIVGKLKAMVGGAPKKPNTPPPQLGGAAGQAQQSMSDHDKQVKEQAAALGFSHGGYAQGLHHQAAEGALSKFHEMMNKETPKFEDGGSYDWSGYDYSDPFYDSGYSDYSGSDYGYTDDTSSWGGMQDYYPSYDEAGYDNSWQDSLDYGWDNYQPESDAWSMGDSGQYEWNGDYGQGYNDYVDSNYWDNGGWGQDQTFSDYYGGTEQWSPYTDMNTYTGAQSPYSEEPSYFNQQQYLGSDANYGWTDPSDPYNTAGTLGRPNMSAGMGAQQGAMGSMGAQGAQQGAAPGAGAAPKSPTAPKAPGQGQEEDPSSILAMKNLTPGIVGGAAPTQNIDLSWKAHGGSVGYAEGGYAQGGLNFMSEGGMGDHYVQGDTPGDGTEDDVNAKLSNGEFVIPADIVAALGNGDNEAGASVLDEFLKVVREHKQENGGELPPDSKGALAYVAQAQQEVGE